MSHQRQQIREAAKTVLIGALTVDDVTTYATSAETRVYETRLLPLTRLKLPAISVYTMEESSTDNDSAPRILTRSMRMALEIAVQQGTNIDDSMDAICVQAERAMHADPTLGGTCGDSVLTSSEFEITEENNKFTGVVTLVYTVTYETFAPDPDDVDLTDDFSTVSVVREMSTEDNSADEDQANDFFEIEVEE